MRWRFVVCCLGCAAIGFALCSALIQLGVLK